MECDNMDDDCDEGKMPWAAFNPLYTYLSEKDEKNFLARCKLCLPKLTSLSCSITSSSNLKGHLKRVHSFTDEKLKSLTLESPNPPSDGKRRKIGSDGAPKDRSKTELFKKKVTQKDVEDAVIQLVISGTLPHRIVDTPEFKQAVLLGLPESLTVPCRQTLRKRLNAYFEVMEANIRAELESVDYVASAADVWTKHHRAFLGINITWLDTDSMERKVAAIALQRLKKRHTHQVLGSAMCEEYERFNLFKNGKLLKCTTDSASNFAKAFGKYTPSTESERDEESSLPIPNYEDISNTDEDNPDEEGEGEEETHCNPIEITDLGENVDGIVLPSHQRCAAHIMDLLAKKDALSALSQSPGYKKIHDSLGDKVNTWHRRQGRSDMVAQIIKDNLGVLFVVPAPTRWNGKFDAFKQIVDLEKTHGRKFDEVLEKADLPTLTPAEWRFLREYVYVMGPVALALDVIQRDKNMFAGYLIPTVLSLQRNLTARRLGHDGKPLKHCGVLVEALLEAIPKPRRFGKYLEDADLSLATCLLPCFKFHWIYGDNRQRATELKAALLNQLAAVEGDVPDAEIRTSSVSAAPAQEPDASVPEASAEDDFFGFNAYRQTSSEPDEVIETAAEELERYLKAPVTERTTVESCYAKRNGSREYPRLCRLFLKYNTPLPSSASIERMFSSSGHSFSDVRNRLGDNTLAIELKLKLNSRFWRK